MTTQADIDRAIAEGKRQVADVDSDTRRRLAARYAGAWERIESELRLVDLLLQAERSGPWFDEDGRFTRYGEVAFRQRRLEALLTLVEQEYARVAVGAASDIASGQYQAVGIGQQTVSSMGLSGGTGAALNVTAYERLVAATDARSPLRGVLDRYGIEARDAIERHLVEGVIQGKGANEIVDTIRAEIGRGVPAWKVSQVARTEAMRAFRGSLFESFDALGVEEWEWHAALSVRTCLACLGMHGRRFPIARQFMEAHPQCRCVPRPVTGRTRPVTGDDWLRRQPEAVQRQRLGPAYDLYQSGKIDLAAFVGRRHSRIWGDSITERSATDVLREFGAMREAA